MFTNKRSLIQRACAGMANEDGDYEEYKWLPAGTCDNILGTHVIGSKENTKFSIFFASNYFLSPYNTRLKHIKYHSL